MCHVYGRTGNPTRPLNDAAFTQYALLAEVAGAEKVNSQGGNWIRYASGLQLCWAASVPGSQTKWNFPVPFSKIPIVTATCVDRDRWTWLRDVSTTGVTNNDDTADIMAIGWWK